MAAGLERSITCEIKNRQKIGDATDSNFTPFSACASIVFIDPHLSTPIFAVTLLLPCALRPAGSGRLGRAFQAIP